jgi:hypothetical protein
MTPVLLEIVAPMLSSLGFGCRGCGTVTRQLGLQKSIHDAACDEYPEHWKEAAARIAEWVQELRRLYKHRIQIKLIDAQSPLGLWKQIRHGVFTLPAFIVDRKCACTGWETGHVESLIDQRLREHQATP